MPERIFYFSLAITIFIIFCRAYFNCSCLNCSLHYSIYIRNEQADNNGSSIIFFWGEEIWFGYFMQMKYRSVNRKFGNMNAAVIISETKILCGAECFCIKRNILNTVIEKKLRSEKWFIVHVCHDCG